MSFVTGSMSFRIFKPSRIPTEEELSEKLAAAVLPPLNTLSEESISGWSGHNHIQDRDINEDSICLGGYVLFHLVQAMRKVSAAILQSECAMEERAVMQAESAVYLNQQRRSEIRKEVKERLLPDTPPTLKAIEICFAGGFCYASACSERQLDALVLSFMQTTGISLVALDPEGMAAYLKKIDVRDFPQRSLTFELPDVSSDISAGREFLTWLWYCSEKRGGLLPTSSSGQIAYMVEGPLDFVMEGKGSHETIIKKGEPMLAKESKAALQAGKTLKSAKITFARGEEVWSCRLDADEFVFRSLKLPQPETFDLVGKFQERMIHLETFRCIFVELYHRYLDERTTSWDIVSKEIKHWVRERPAS